MNCFVGMHKPASKTSKWIAKAWPCATYYSSLLWQAHLRVTFLRCLRAFVPGVYLSGLLCLSPSWTPPGSVSRGVAVGASNICDMEDQIQTNRIVDNGVNTVSMKPEKS